MSKKYEKNPKYGMRDTSFEQAGTCHLVSYRSKDTSCFSSP